MTIALPIHQGRLSPLLDTASRLLVLTCRDGQETGRREIILAPQAPEALARALAELHPDLLLCGAASEPLLHALHEIGLHVWPHLCGDVEVILHACCHGQLARKEFRIPGCHKQHRVAGECGRPRRRRRHAHTIKSTINQTSSTQPH